MFLLHTTIILLGAFSDVKYVLCSLLFLLNSSELTKTITKNLLAFQNFPYLLTEHE